VFAFSSSGLRRRSAPAAGDGEILTPGPRHSGPMPSDQQLRDSSGKPNRSVRRSCKVHLHHRHRNNCWN
jgi:hypothetical protein